MEGMRVLGALECVVGVKVSRCRVYRRSEGVRGV